MKFEVYCDESRPDLLCSLHPQARYIEVVKFFWTQ